MAAGIDTGAPRKRLPDKRRALHRQRPSCIDRKSAAIYNATGTSLKSTGLPTSTFCGFGPSCPVSTSRLNT
ncbi:hypothetical protein BCO37747_01998 [Burkholderia contaminans]|jgi:hypothetical protein|nr:hypothetical protein BCO23253_03050 [Burkholderia contaminans]VWC93010.1 hypothetical protein BCO37747_01998 [Burkholderia contaminans]